MSDTLTLRPEGESDGGGFPARESAPNNSVFEATVLEAQVRDSRWTDDETGELKKEVNFKFEVDDPAHPDFKGRWFWGSTNVWFSQDPRCKLRQWVEAILDEDILPEGFQVKTEELVGKPVRIIVKAKDRAEGDERPPSNWVSECRISKKATAASPHGLNPNPDDPF